MVLGGGWQPDTPRSIIGKLNESSAIRLLEGVRLWRQRYELPLILSGGSRLSNRPPVAQGYAQAAVALEVPGERLVVLDTPTDTGHEAHAARETLGKGAALILVCLAHTASHAALSRGGLLAPMAAPTHYLVAANALCVFSDWVPSARHLRKTERTLYEAMGKLALNFE